MPNREYQVEILVDAYAVYPVTVQARNAEEAMRKARNIPHYDLPEPDIREFSETQFCVVDPETDEEVFFS